MLFYKLERKFIPTGADYVFEDLASFEKILPYMYEKIEGHWFVIFVDLKIDEVRKLTTTLGVPEYINIHVHLKQDVLGLFYAQNPKFKTKEKSKWEQYIDVVASFPKLIEKRASREIFKRCAGNIETIRDTLNELLIISEDSEEIEMKHVNSVLLAEEVVFARDVVLTLLLKGNKLVPRKGHRLSRYKYKNPYELYNKLEQSLGQDMAFFAMRKFAKKLYEEKQKYLQNKEVTESDVMGVIDVYTIMHTYLAFYLSSPRQTIPVLYTIERRDFNDSNLRNTILANYG